MITTHSVVWQVRTESFNSDNSMIEINPNYQFELIPKIIFFFLKIYVDMQ